MPQGIPADVWDSLTEPQRQSLAKYLGNSRKPPQRRHLDERDVDMTSVEERHGGFQTRMAPRMSDDAMGVYSNVPLYNAATLWEAMNIHVAHVVQRNDCVRKRIGAVDEPMIAPELHKSIRETEQDLRQALYGTFIAGINLDTTKMLVHSSEGRQHFFQQDLRASSVKVFRQDLDPVRKTTNQTLHELIDLADMLQTGP